MKLLKLPCREESETYFEFDSLVAKYLKGFYVVNNVINPVLLTLEELIDFEILYTLDEALIDALS